MNKNIHIIECIDGIVDFPIILLDFLMVFGGSLFLIGSEVAASVDAWTSSLADNLLDFLVVSGGSLFSIDSVVIASGDTWIHSLADNLLDLRGNLDTWGSSPMSILRRQVPPLGVLYQVRILVQ